MILLVTMLFGSGWADSPIKSVEIKSLPEQGMAFRQFFPDGKVKGGHISEGRVYEDSIQLEKAKADEIWSLASDLFQRKLFKGPLVWDKDSHKKMYLVVHLENHQEFGIAWPERQTHPDPKVQKLAEILLHYRVGGW